MTWANKVLPAFMSFPPDPEPETLTRKPLALKFKSTPPENAPNHLLLKRFPLPTSKLTGHHCHGPFYPTSHECDPWALLSAARAHSSARRSDSCDKKRPGRGRGCLPRPGLCRR